MQGSKDSMVFVIAKPVQYQNGWGYDILVSNKIYIHQEIVPALLGNKYFLTKEDAQKIGNLVIQKMMRKKYPVIDSLDLVKAGVNYK